MRLSNEATAEQLRASTAPRYVKPQALDQLEEWMKEKPIPYISNDKFSQEGIFDYWAGRLPGHAHGNQTYDIMELSPHPNDMSLGCGDSSMVALHLEAG